MPGSDIQYSDVAGSIKYIGLEIIGSSDHSAFVLGKKTQEEILYFLFVVSCFVSVITLLNILIAIMGNSFAERNLRTKEIKIRNQLNFVVDNWHLLDISFWETQNIKYVLTALRHDEENEQAEQLQHLKETIYKV